MGQGRAEGHLWLVHAIVNRLAAQWPGIDRDELEAAGNLGLVEAADRYDPDRAMPFTKWARIRIEGAVIDSVRGHYWGDRRTSDPAIARLWSLDYPVGDPADGITVADLLADTRNDLDGVDNDDHLDWLLGHLKPRPRAVVRNRLAGNGHAVLADRWGVTQPRVSQMWTAAAARLRECADR